MLNGCTKYEHDSLNIVGCRVVINVRWTDEQTNGQMDRQKEGQGDGAGHNNNLQPKWVEGKTSISHVLDLIQLDSC